MWGAGYAIGLILGVLYWLLVLRPDEKNRYRRKLDIIRQKLARIRQRKIDAKRAELRAKTEVLKARRTARAADKNSTGVECDADAGDRCNETRRD